jgi:GT2 family glycosyltransferase
MESENSISIVIVNYNGKDFLLNCLESIFACDYKNFEVILVDNKSTDNSSDLAKEKFPKIKVVYNEKNLGASGRNSGILKAKGKFIVLLDSDTIVPSNWLFEFLKSYEQHGYGLYQGKLLFMDEPEKINSAGCMLNIFGFSFARGSGEIDKGQYDDQFEISFPASTCAFMPKDIFEKIGLFDIEFFAYVEDTDFGWRALMQGIPSYFVPKVVVFHKGSPNTAWNSKKFYLLERNRQICLHTNFSKKSFWKLMPFLIILEIGTSLYYLRKGMFIEKLLAYSYIIKHRSYLSKRYKNMLLKRTVTDKDVTRQFSDEIWVPKDVIKKSSNSFLNKFIEKLSKYARSVL